METLRFSFKPQDLLTIPSNNADPSMLTGKINTTINKNNYPALNTNYASQTNFDTSINYWGSGGGRLSSKSAPQEIKSVTYSEYTARYKLSNDDGSYITVFVGRGEEYAFI